MLSIKNQLKSTVKQIQELQSLDFRLPQNRPWSSISPDCEVIFVYFIRVHPVNSGSKVSIPCFLFYGF